MSNRILQSILEGAYRPDFIYRAADNYIYSPRPLDEATSILFGRDPITRLLRWDLAHGLPVGADLQEIAPDVYAGTFGRSGGLTLYPLSPSQTPNLLQASASSLRVPDFRGANSPYSLPALDGTNLQSMYGSGQRTPGHQGRSGSFPDNVGGPSLFEVENDFGREPVRAGPYRFTNPLSTPSFLGGPDYFSSGGPSRVPEATSCDLSAESRDLLDALDDYYFVHLKPDTGHRFDDVDDYILIAYLSACNDSPRWHWSEKLTAGPVTRAPNGAHLKVPFLNLPQPVLEVSFPLDHASVRNLSNDVLRVLHIFLATTDHAPDNQWGVPDDEVAESRREVLRQLESRGFTERCTPTVRLCGLKSRPTADADTAADAVSSFMPELRRMQSATQSTKVPKTDATEKACGSKDCCNKSHRKVNKNAKSSKNSTGEVSEKKKGKAPVGRDYEVSHSVHSNATPSSSAMPTESADSDSEHSHSDSGDSVAATKSTTSRVGTPLSPEEPQSQIDGGPASYMDFGSKLKPGGLRIHELANA